MEERIMKFNSECFNLLRYEDEQMRIDFTDYWTEHSLNGKKFRAEKEKVFDIKKRFATWKRNQMNWNKNKENRVVQVLSAYEIAKQKMGI